MLSTAECIRREYRDMSHVARGDARLWLRDWGRYLAGVARLDTYRSRELDPLKYQAHDALTEVWRLKNSLG